MMPHFQAGARGGGRRLVSIERVCVVGGGVIGSLYAAHLSRVADVWVLTRRPEHARALEEQGLEVSGRAEFTGRVHATDDRPSCRTSMWRSSQRRGRRSTRRLPARSRGGSWARWSSRSRTGSARADRPPARRLAARLRCHLHERHQARRQARRVHPRHETWLGPYNGIPYERVEELAELISAPA